MSMYQHASMTLCLYQYISEATFHFNVSDFHIRISMCQYLNANNNQDQAQHHVVVVAVAAAAAFQPMKTAIGSMAL